MHTTSPKTERLRVSLVEDDAHMATMLRYNIEAAGHAVDWIDNGAAALTRLRAIPPDLLVLDWMLPGLSGIEIVRQLRAGQSTRSVPVLMVTGRCEATDRTRALAAGVDGFVVKPFSLGAFMVELRVLLHAALDRSQLRYDKVRV